MTIIFVSGTKKPNQISVKLNKVDLFVPKNYKSQTDKHYYIPFNVATSPKRELCFWGFLIVNLKK